MTDLFDTTQVPDNPGYWDALAQRIASEAASQSSRAGLGWVAHSRASWVSATLLLAAGVAFIVVPVDDSTGESITTEWVQALSPTDDAGRSLFEGDGPPPIEALLFNDQGGE